MDATKVTINLEEERMRVLTGRGTSHLREPGGTAEILKQ